MQVGADTEYLGRCLRYMSHCEQPLVRIDRWQVSNEAVSEAQYSIHISCPHYTGARLPCHACLLIRQIY